MLSSHEFYWVWAHHRNLRKYSNFLLKQFCLSEAYFLSWLKSISSFYFFRCCYLDRIDDFHLFIENFMFSKQKSIRLVGRGRKKRIDQKDKGANNQSLCWLYSNQSYVCYTISFCDCQCNCLWNISNLSNWTSNGMFIYLSIRAADSFRSFKWCGPLNRINCLDNHCVHHIWSKKWAF